MIKEIKYLIFFFIIVFFIFFTTKYYFSDTNKKKTYRTLNNFDKSCNVDVFFALSHGVHRGVLKSGKNDGRTGFTQGAS